MYFRRAIRKPSQRQISDALRVIENLLSGGRFPRSPAPIRGRSRRRYNPEPTGGPAGNPLPVYWDGSGRARRYRGW